MIRKLIYLCALVLTLGLSACSNSVSIPEDIEAGPVKIPKQDVSIKFYSDTDDDGTSTGITVPIKLECVKEMDGIWGLTNIELALCDKDGIEMAIIVSNISDERLKPGRKFIEEFSSTIGDAHKTEEDWKNIISQTETITLSNYTES